MTDSLSPEKLSPDHLSKKIFEKHRRMFEDYQREFEVRKKLAVLKEKKDLLEHWLKSAKEDGSKGYEKYKRDKKRVGDEISSLVSELQDVSMQDIGKESRSESKKRYSFLEEKIGSHKEAMEHWDNRAKELSKKKKKAKKSSSKKKKAKKR